MKIYLTYSKRLPANVVEELKNALEKLASKVELRDHSQDLDTYNFDEARKLFQRNIKGIKSSDIIVVECSYASSGLGYEISHAIDEKKPLIALYNLNIDKEHPRHIKRIPISLKGNPSKYLILKEYDHNSLKKTLELAVNDAKALADTKFILIIPASIDRYLEWNVKERGKSKAEITREAIEKQMQEDQRYQEYLKSSGLIED